MKKLLMQPRNVGNHLCPYCGIRRGRTVDHIIPRCLFPAKIPSGVYIPTVKACPECNAQSRNTMDFSAIFSQHILN